MSIRTIYLAIRVVKNALSDTRSKVTAWGDPERGRVLGLCQASGGNSGRLLASAAAFLPPLPSSSVRGGEAAFSRKAL